MGESSSMCRFSISRIVQPRNFVSNFSLSFPLHTVSSTSGRRSHQLSASSDQASRDRPNRNTAIVDKPLISHRIIHTGRPIFPRYSRTRPTSPTAN